jgi:tetratricopeptide (TPR) repeat protein
LRHKTSPIVLSLLALAILLHPLPAASGVEEADSFYSKGRDLLNAGNPAEAGQAFARAIAENPLHGEARLQLANVCSRDINTYAKAEELYQGMPEVAGKLGARARDDLLFRSGVGLGRLLVKSGRNEEAASVLRNSISSAPGGAALDEAYNALGLAHYYERHYEDAIFDMRQAIKRNPNNEFAKFNLKTIRTRLEHFQAGKLYSRLGDRPRAVAEYRRAIELDPRFVDARYRLGVEHLAAGNLQEALKELRRAGLVSASYRKGYEIWYVEGLTLLRLKRVPDAMTLFERTVQARPRFAPAHNEIGKIRLERGEYDAAIEHFVKAIGSDPRAEYARGLQIAMTRKAQQPAAKEPGAAAPK